VCSAKKLLGVDERLLTQQKEQKGTSWQPKSTFCRVVGKTRSLGKIGTAHSDNDTRVDKMQKLTAGCPLNVGIKIQAFLDNKNRRQFQYKKKRF